MSIINGLSTINGGTVRQFSNGKYSYEVELMGKGYSTHPDNIVATYFMDDSIKTSLILWAGKLGEAVFCISKYKGINSPEHYYSRKYEINELPKKYEKYAKELVRAYSITFNNAKMAFNYPAHWGLI